MKKFVAVAICAIILSFSLCSAAGKTGILIIAPAQFKTQDFLKIANENFGKNYVVSQQTQDAWATYCWDKGFVDSDPTISKEILANFAETTYFDKIIFIMFKNAEITVEDEGVNYSASPFFGGILGNAKRKVRRRSVIEARVVVMNRQGETVKIFEESHTDASMASELRANRGAFNGLCKSIASRLNERISSK